MYVVRDRRTGAIIHTSAATPSEGLTEREVYASFDPDTMEIGMTGSPIVPGRFHITETGEIVGIELHEQIEAGIVSLGPGEKFVGGEIVPKTISELVADGVLSLPPSHKIVVEAGEERLVEKTLPELVADQFVTLDPRQTLVGEEIRDKTTQEQIDDGLITREDVKESAVRRLRQEIETYFREHKTTNGYRLDELARQKAIFSYPYRALPHTDPTKQSLLQTGFIYPDVILDDILREVGKVQVAYSNAKQAVVTAADRGDAVEEWESISIHSHL